MSKISNKASSVARVEQEELFSYVNGLLLYISKNTKIPSKELIDIFVEYNSNNNATNTGGKEMMKGKESKESKKSRKNKKKKEIYLEYIILDKKEYLLDNLKNDLYTFDDNKTFIGKYDIENDCINYIL